jgi:hypothetical protein
MKRVLLRMMGPMAVLLVTMAEIEKTSSGSTSGDGGGSKNRTGGTFGQWRRRKQTLQPKGRGARADQFATEAGK